MDKKEAKVLGKYAMWQLKECNENTNFFRSYSSCGGGCGGCGGGYNSFNCEGCA